MKVVSRNNWRGKTVSHSISLYGGDDGDAMDEDDG